MLRINELRQSRGAQTIAKSKLSKSEKSKLSTRNPGLFEAKLIAEELIRQTASETIESLQKQVYSRLSKRELMKVLAGETRLKNDYVAKYYELRR